MRDKPKRKTKNQNTSKTWTRSRTIYVAIWGLIYGVLLEVLFDGQLLNQHLSIQLIFFMIIPFGIGGLSTLMIPASRRNIDITMYVTLFSAFVFFVFAASKDLIVFVGLLLLPWGLLGIAAYSLFRISLRILAKFRMRASNG